MDWVGSRCGLRIDEIIFDDPLGGEVPKLKKSALCAFFSKGKARSSNKFGFGLFPLLKRLSLRDSLFFNFGGGGGISNPR